MSSYFETEILQRKNRTTPVYFIYGFINIVQALNMNLDYSWVVVIIFEWVSGQGMTWQKINHLAFFSIYRLFSLYYMANLFMARKSLLIENADVYVSYNYWWAVTKR